MERKTIMAIAATSIATTAACYYLFKYHDNHSGK